MSTQRDNDKLDRLISSTINTEKPQFDAEKWKRKYPDEYKTLISRREKAASSRRPNILRVIFGKPATQIAAAAAVILVAGLLLSRDGQKPYTSISKSPLIPQSAAQIVSMASMRMAYQRGGLEALDQQFRDTLEVLGPTSSSISMQEILEGFNDS
ncbi:MAG: hypothetical protein ACYS3S_19300 [Planctomycetota bacterium]|jgi:hypothetical protein